MRNLWLLLAVLICVQSVLELSSFAKSRRHLVLYGGIKDADIKTIANYADILIVGGIRHEQLLELKRLNPKLIILKYAHPTGIHKTDLKWDIVNQNEHWFVHDRDTNRRLVERKYGWYLTDLSNPQWRSFICNAIKEDLDKRFDGVFLDDIWPRFVKKFVCEGMRSPGAPKHSIEAEWIKSMKLFLAQVRQQFHKLVFINGLHKIYSNSVDGMMSESFVHSSWNSDSFYPNPSDYMRSLLAIKSLEKFGKTILVQSGTKGDGTGDIDKLYRYCLASYLLVCNENTSFGFQPSESYYFRRLSYPEDYEMELGKPLGDYRAHNEGTSNPNLVINGDFENGLIGWVIASGNPSIAQMGRFGNKSLRLRSRARKLDRIRSAFLPVEPNRNYTIAVWCKAAENSPGSADYKKLGLQGSFYDKGRHLIAGAYDLQFSAGTYDWLPFEITHKSPNKAAYFQIILGFIGDGRGEGLVDNVYFGVASNESKIYRRDYSQGIAFVNCGAEDGVVELGDNKAAGGLIEINIKAHEGIILSTPVEKRLSSKDSEVFDTSKE